MATILAPGAQPVPTSGPVPPRHGHRRLVLGAAVLAAMSVLGTLGVTVNVDGWIPLTDNMTGGNAQRPGDVFRARNGKTVEVLNTDAEGRLVLADALSLAADYTMAAVAKAPANRMGHRGPSV